MKEIIETSSFDNIIDECNTLSKKLDKVCCIFSASEKSLFYSTAKIAQEFFVDSEDLLSYYPSLKTFYDTETKSKDIITRHQIVIDFLKEIGFYTNSLNFGYFNIENCSKLEITYYSELHKNVKIRVKPNLMITIVIIPNEFAPNKELTFFFNRIRILNEIAEVSPNKIKREIKIDKILKIK